MSGFKLVDLQTAAAADLRPTASTLDEVPTGTSPVEQAVAGYIMAVNLVTQAVELDCDAGWRRRQRLYAAEIGRLQTHGGTVDPDIVDRLRTERDSAVLNARCGAEPDSTIQSGYEKIFELMGPEHARSIPTEVRERMAATIDEINALTQRLIDEYRPGDSVYEFLSARTLDTTVPPY